MVCRLEILLIIITLRLSLAAGIDFLDFVLTYFIIEEYII